MPERVGRYRIIGRLAAGGMAEILLASIDGVAGISRPVVVKRVLPKLARRTDFRKMFVDEARIVSNLRHANVVSVLELGEDLDALYLVMEYLEGESLDVLLRRLAGAGTRLDPLVATYVVAEACAGLHAAHELRDTEGTPQMIVHRDVSPQNLFVGYDGSVKVIDFGIAKAANRETKTETGTIKGKFAYMAPEQIEGARIDRRADVFALGVVLWEMLVGRRLFQRPGHLEIVKAICFSPIPAPRDEDPGVPEVLDAIARKALARDLDERYASAAEMRRDLALAMRDLGPGALPADELARLMRQVFEERIHAKREMLRRIASGSQITSVPVAVDVELDDLDEPEHAPAAGELRPTEAATEPARRAARPSLAVAIGLTAVLASGAAAAAWLGARGETASPMVEPPEPPPETAATGAPADPVSAPSEPSAEGERAPTTVSIAIDSAPSGARVRIAGEERGTTPLALGLPRSDEVVEIVVELDGYRAARELVASNVDQRVRVALERLPRRASGARGAERVAPDAPARPIFRVD